MKFRFLFILLLAAAMCCPEWTGVRAAFAGQDTGSNREEVLKKKRKKPKKSKKKKPKKTNTSKKAAKKPSEEEKKKQAAKKQKKQEKNIQRLADEKEKKEKQKAKAQKKREDYDKCDSTRIVRTSSDTLQLVKYIKVYHSLGGACYILHLQQMGKLVKTSDGFYNIKMKPSSDPRAPADWQTYLFCPIGKPDGMVALCSPAGDTVQVCSYLGEKKHGLMSWFKKGEGVIHQERYVNDEKVWGIKPE